MRKQIEQGVTMQQLNAPDFVQNWILHPPVGQCAVHISWMTACLGPVMSVQGEEGECKHVPV